MDKNENPPICSYCRQHLRYGEKVGKFRHDHVHENPGTCISRLAERLAVTEARLAKMNNRLFEE
mgnify:CR=1 FL=1